MRTRRVAPSFPVLDRPPAPELRRAPPHHLEAIDRVLAHRRDSPSRDRASQRRQPIGNFILPSDVDANGDLRGTVTSFPAHVLKLMCGYWKQHIPLDQLTPKAIKDSHRRPQSDISYARPTADGSFAFVTKELDDYAESLLVESEWRQGFPNLLRLIHYHSSRENKDQIVQGLQEHYEWMTSQPDFYTDFVLYLRYDIEIRKLVATMTNYVPKAVEINIFTDTEKQFVRDLARGVITNTDNTASTRPRSRSPSPRRGYRASNSRPQYGPRSPQRTYASKPRGFDSRGQSFRAASASTFCIVCGHTGHSSTACNTTSAPHLVFEKATNRWLAPGGGQFCYRWNNNSLSCKQCQRDHRCTLCGDRSHNARACARAAA